MRRLGVGKLLFAMLLICARSALADLFTFTNIDVPGAYSTYALGINNLGQIVGNYDNASGEHGFLYSGGVFTTLAILTGPGASNPFFPVAINDQGQIVGSAAGLTGAFASCLYSGGSCTPIIDPQSKLPVDATGINDSGQIVGYEVGAPGLAGDIGFIDTGGTFTYFNYGNSGTQISGINNSGQIIGRCFEQNVCTFGFVENSPYNTASCAPPNCTFLNGFPTGINDAGLIVGEFAVNNDFAGLYAGGNYIPVNDPNASPPTMSEGINNSDEIVGWYNPGSHGFLASPTTPLVPEPRTFPGLFLCLLPLAVGLRCRSKRIKQL